MSVVMIDGHNKLPKHYSVLKPLKEGEEQMYMRALVDDIIKERKRLGLSQRELAIQSGVKQPVIARMESGTNVPNLSTILKLLAPLGKTLCLCDLLRK